METSFSANIREREVVVGDVVIPRDRPVRDPLADRQRNDLGRPILIANVRQEIQLSICVPG